MPEQYVDMQQLLHAYGVDCFLAAELRYWLTRVISSDVIIFGIQGDRSIATLSLLITKKSEYSALIYLDRPWKASVCLRTHMFTSDSACIKARFHRASWD